LDRNPLLGIFIKQRVEMVVDPDVILCKCVKFFADLRLPIDGGRESIIHCQTIRLTLNSQLWRVPTHTHPAATGGNDYRIVHIQSYNRRTPNGCQTNHECA
jgi:hypothetical protein